MTSAQQLDEEGTCRVAEQYDKSPAQILLRWDLQLGVVPLPKADRRDHLAQNLDVFDFQLTDEHMDELGRMNEQ